MENALRMTTRGGIPNGEEGLREITTPADNARSGTGILPVREI
jgi:hypothetical protein